MVKQQDFSIAKTHGCKGVSKPGRRANKISAFTVYDTCREQLSPFGGLLALIKFWDLIQFKQLDYLSPVAFERRYYEQRLAA